MRLLWVGEGGKGKGDGFPKVCRLSSIDCITLINIVPCRRPMVRLHRVGILPKRDWKQGFFIYILRPRFWLLLISGLMENLLGGTAAGGRPCPLRVLYTVVRVYMGKYIVLYYHPHHYSTLSISQHLEVMLRSSTRSVELSR